MTSIHPAAAAATASLVQVSALEPVEFAIDRPLWRRTSSLQTQRLDSLVDLCARGQSCTADAAKMESATMASSVGVPSVVTPILTTAQLDADCMEDARAILDYPWHYNFIPAARRAPVGTAGFAATSSIEQDRRRGLLNDARERKAFATASFDHDATQDELLPTIAPSIGGGGSARMLMGYSRSLSGVALQRGLPCLEINGHPVSLSADRPSSATGHRVTVG